ncbi:unnamed protein product [Parascedosporium putredinis]|uniref:Uncharacterized protein n=1 Tax=Parascedosporium putredinis TaxID=1442378 RepID=A0A9P1MAH7_9PEZI|nr:unnamed protein product [Parascedosporium putredinis]CAI7993960.1 unnamed protein product [Parascedosporium putredinis]
MPTNPDWVKALKPSGPQGSELLAQERAKSTVNVEQLSNFMFTKDVLARKANIEKILRADPVFDKSQNYFRARTDRIEVSLARAKALRLLSVKHNWSKEEYETANSLMAEATPTASTPPCSSRPSRSRPPRSRRSSSSSPPRTTRSSAATPRPSSATAPTSAASRPPPPGTPRTRPSPSTPPPHRLQVVDRLLGKAANHAVVVAQLILNGKSRGPHPFIVPIRDLKTHLPLPGVHVGDIGPKFGFNTMDNGFLLFKDFKIPHVNMLARFAAVDPATGKYLQPANPALVYGTMTYIRSGIVFESGSVLARGVTIATRYCAVRRQFQDRDAPDGEVGENQVLNYTMVQHRLLPSWPPPTPSTSPAAA